MTATRRRVAKDEQRAKVQHADEFLRDVEEVTVVLDSGKQVSFSMEDELCIPGDPEHFAQEVRRAAARLAFWSYQVERSLRTVRRLEARLTEQEGLYTMAMRQKMKDDSERDGSTVYVSDATLRAAVANVDQVKEVRRSLDRARNDMGVLRSVRDAHQVRCKMLSILAGFFRQFE
jgi:hypothetical protein